MKKTYIAPITNKVKVGVSRMVCVSDGQLDKGQSITTRDGFGSRRGSTWDDEEE
jgi:hypothetical protein